MNDYDDWYDWYDEGECPHCGAVLECEHDDPVSDRDDAEDDDDYLGSREIDRPVIVATKALTRCGILPGSGAWGPAMAALLRRLDEQVDDPLALRRPGWTVALPF